MTTVQTDDILAAMIWNGPDNASATVALAHGAGQPMDSPFMTSVAEGLADAGFRVARFEFPYMARRRITGRKGGPDRAPVLCETWHAVIRHISPDNLVIGGKSMGGRIASMVADEAGVAGLICFGYPFHPPGKPEKLRTEHLATLRTPTLICQGERDPFGTSAEVDDYTLSAAIKVEWLGDGDHSFKPRKKSGRTEAQNVSEAIELAARFTESVRSANDSV